MSWKVIPLSINAAINLFKTGNGDVEYTVQVDNEILQGEEDKENDKNAILSSIADLKEFYGDDIPSDVLESANVLLEGLENIE